jgi:hypothetical protein
VEKIWFIHSSVGVYYHHYPFFLSKLTKEGKVSKRGQEPLTATPTRRERNFVYKKKSEASSVARTTATMTPTVIDPDCRRLFELERRHDSTSAWSTGRTRRR